MSVLSASELVGLALIPSSIAFAITLISRKVPNPALGIAMYMLFSAGAWFSKHLPVGLVLVLTVLSISGVIFNMIRYPKRLAVDESDHTDTTF